MSKKLFSLPIVVVMLVSLVLATVAAAPPPQAEGKTYTIQKDDWLSKLAEKEYGDPLAFTAIFYFNNLKATDDDSMTLIDDPDLVEVFRDEHAVVFQVVDPGEAMQEVLRGN